jgi:hypothetical protein
VTENKSGSNGGNARAENLSKEKTHSIASEAAKKRWSEYRRKKAEEESKPVTINESSEPVPYIYPESNPDHFGESESDKEPKHCPACLAGQSLEEGEGTHILATVEHPVTLPVEFENGESSVVASVDPTPPVITPKPSKRPSKPVPKEFKSAGTYAEKRVIQANKERSVHVGEISKHQSKIEELDAEINGLLPIIQALGGQLPVGMPSAAVQTYQPRLNQLTDYDNSSESALYQANNSPIPHLTPIIQPSEMIPGGVGGGAVDLDYPAN